MTKIYVDLDGVLADHLGEYERRFGEKIRTNNVHWKNVASVDRWFFNLPLTPDAHILIDYLKSHPYGFEVLTATGNDYEDVSQQKRDWCLLKFGLPASQVNTVKSGIDKAVYVKTKYDILVDDTPKVIAAWIAAGGTGILHTSAEDTIKQLNALSQR